MLLIPIAAASTPVTHGLTPTSAPQFNVSVYATDGFTSQSVYHSSNDHHIGGFARTRTVGILAPVFLVDEFGMSQRDITFSGDIGSELMLLELSVVDYLWFNSGGALNGTGGSNVFPDMIRGSANGSLSWAGHTTAFSLDLDRSAGNYFQMDFPSPGDTDTFGLVTRVGCCSIGAAPILNSVLIGNLGGVDFRMSLSSTFNAEISNPAVFDAGASPIVPEPSTALLLSLGLTGLAAKRRRSLRS